MAPIVAPARWRPGTIGRRAGEVNLENVIRRRNWASVGRRTLRAVRPASPVAPLRPRDLSAENPAEQSLLRSLQCGAHILPAWRMTSDRLDRQIGRWVPAETLTKPRHRGWIRQRGGFIPKFGTSQGICQGISNILEQTRQRDSS